MYKIGKYVNRNNPIKFKFVLNGANGDPMEYDSKEDALCFLVRTTGEELTLEKYEEYYGYYIFDPDTYNFFVNTIPYDS